MFEGKGAGARWCCKNRKRVIAAAVVATAADIDTQLIETIKVL